MLEISCNAPLPANLPFGNVENAIRAAVAQTLRQQEAQTDADLTIVLSDNAELHALNQQFLGEDKPTDVLSFPTDQSVPFPMETAYLGDIIISLEKAQTQADERGHPLLAELQLLTVHGVLHLLGHDHYQEDEKASMWAAQADILAQLGNNIVLPE